jgi:ribosomal protein L4
MKVRVAVSSDTVKAYKAERNKLGADATDEAVAELKNTVFGDDVLEAFKEHQRRDANGIALLMDGERDTGIACDVRDGHVVA